MTVATTVATTGVAVVSATIRFGYGVLRDRWRSSPVLVVEAEARDDARAGPAAELKEELE